MGLKGEKIVKSMHEWVDRNPKAYKVMVDTALHYRSVGRKIPIKKLIEDARFELHINGESEGFKINNNMSPALARHMMANVPGLAGYFEIKKSVVDSVNDSIV